MPNLDGWLNPPFLKGDRGGFVLCKILPNPPLEKEGILRGILNSAALRQKT